MNDIDKLRSEYFSLLEDYFTTWRKYEILSKQGALDEELQPLMFSMDDIYSSVVELNKKMVDLIHIDKYNEHISQHKIDFFPNVEEYR